MIATLPYLPPHMRDGMDRYLDHGVAPGGFLLAVLSNDLKGAVTRADSINLKHLSNIVCYCYDTIPSNSWGSPDNVNQWIAMHKQELARKSDDK